MTIIPEVGNTVTQIRSAEFVKITVYNDYANTANVTVFPISSSYKSETINGTVYDPLGGLIAVGAQNRDLRVTSGDTNIVVSGIGGDSIGLVLDLKVRGSEVEVIRGFYNANMVLQNTYPRFSGIITSYSLEEVREGNENSFTVVLSASSYKTVLQNRIAGRKTNKESWRFFNSTDASMDNVYAISGVSFDFGQPPRTNVLTGGGDNAGGGDSGFDRREFN